MNHHAWFMCCWRLKPGLPACWSLCHLSHTPSSSSPPRNHVLTVRCGASCLALHNTHYLTSVGRLRHVERVTHFSVICSPQSLGARNASSAECQPQEGQAPAHRKGRRGLGGRPSSHFHQGSRPDMMALGWNPSSLEVEKTRLSELSSAT